MSEHRRAADIAPLWLIDAEHRTEIAQSRRGEQCVAQRVDGDVAVGVTRATIVAVEKKPEQPARPTHFDGVDVSADTDSGERHG